MIIASLVAGLLLAAVPNIVWLVGKIIALIAHKRLSYAPFGWSGLGLAVVFWGIIAYGYFCGRWGLDVNHVEYSHAEIPAPFNGFKIVHISDLHLSTFDDKPAQLQRIIETVNAQQPDLICFTGDMVTIGTREAKPYTEMLKGLKATYGVASVMGNHDFLIYGNRFKRDTAAHNAAVEEFAAYQREELGWHLLRNSSFPITKDSAQIAIMGVDNKSCTNQGFKSTNLGDLSAAMEGTGGFRILLSHDPTHWAAEVVPQTDIPLTLSGHTHAAQVKLFGFTPASWTFPHTHGLYEQDGQTLYINIGLGCTAPVRIGATPEITVITFSSAHPYKQK